MCRPILFTITHDAIAYLTSPQLVELGEIGLFDIEYCQCSPQHSSPFVTDNESRTNQLPINRFTDNTVFTSLSSFALSAMADYGALLANLFDAAKK